MTKKKEPKWKPKKFVMGVTIDMKTGKTTPSEVIQAKTPEEEKEWEKGFTERWAECMKILWGDKFDWFVRNTKHLIDKYGEEEFTRRWTKTMKEIDKKEKLKKKSKEKLITPSPKRNSEWQSGANQAKVNNCLI